jgi:hypothetical protein
MEASTIGFSTSTPAELEEGFTLLKVCDEGFDGGFELGRGGPALRIEHD